MFGMWVDRYTCQYRVVKGLFELTQWKNNTQMRNKIEGGIKIPLVCPYRKEAL